VVARWLEWARGVPACTSDRVFPRPSKSVAAKRLKEKGKEEKRVKEKPRVIAELSASFACFAV